MTGGGNTRLPEVILADAVRYVLTRAPLRSAGPASRRHDSHVMPLRFPALPALRAIGCRYGFRLSR